MDDASPSTEEPRDFAADETSAFRVTGGEKTVLDFCSDGGGGGGARRAVATTLGLASREVEKVEEEEEEEEGNKEEGTPAAAPASEPAKTLIPVLEVNPAALYRTPTSATL